MVPAPTPRTLAGKCSPSCLACALEPPLHNRVVPTSLAQPATSQRQRLRWAIAVSVAVALYAFALWCEAACESGGIGHTELLTWKRMAGALSVAKWSDFRIYWVWPLEPTTLLGMVGALVWLALRPVPEGAVARVVVWVYCVLLLLVGGWIGLIVLIDTPRQFPLDGEFLDESDARLAAIGFWMLLCLYAAWVARPRWAELDRLECVV